MIKFSILKHEGVTFKLTQTKAPIGFRIETLTN